MSSNSPSPYDLPPGLNPKAIRLWTDVRLFWPHLKLDEWILNNEYDPLPEDLAAEREINSRLAATTFVVLVPSIALSSLALRRLPQKISGATRFAATMAVGITAITAGTSISSRFTQSYAEGIMEELQTPLGQQYRELKRSITPRQGTSSSPSWSYFEANKPEKNPYGDEIEIVASPTAKQPSPSTSSWRDEDDKDEWAETVPAGTHSRTRREYQSHHRSNAYGEDRGRLGDWKETDENVHSSVDESEEDERALKRARRREAIRQRREERARREAGRRWEGDEDDGGRTRGGRGDDHGYGSSRREERLREREERPRRARRARDDDLPERSF